MSDGDEPCHASNSPVARLSTLKGRLTKNALPETQRNPVVLTQLQESDPKVTASPNLQGNLIPDSEAGQGIVVADQVADIVEMTIAPSKSEAREASKINGNVMENQEGKKEETHLHQGSPNRAIYEFKHQDTDVEDSPKLERKGVCNLSKNNFNTIVEDVSPGAASKSVMRETSNYNLNLSSLGRVGRRSWQQQREEPDEEYDSDGLQKIIDSSIMEPDWLKVESDGLEDPSCEEGSDEPPALETMDTGSEEGPQQSRTSLAAPSKLDSSIHQLVNAAENLVKATPLPSPIVSPRTPISLNLGGSRCRVPPSNLGPLSFEVTSPRSVKHERVQSWLATQPCAPALLDSCDASGEMTTGESEGDSSCESGDFTLTSHMAKDLPQSVVTTPVVERPANLTLGSEPTKAVLRNRRRRAGERRRPWSVLDNGSRQTALTSTPSPQKHSGGTVEKTRKLLTATQRSSFTSSDPTLASSSGETISRPVEQTASGLVLNAVPEGSVPSASIEQRGCASDSALDASGVVAGGRIGVEPLAECLRPSASAALAPSDSPITAPAPAACAVTDATLAALAPATGVQRRRKHKLRRRSNISLHTRGSDSGSDKAGAGNHRMSVSASDCGASVACLLRGIVKSSSFAGHPLTMPELPVSPTATLTCLPDHGFVCCPSDVTGTQRLDKVP
ncbi:uncharacterized protein LOC108672190, partial [Hyalella azteca]|uniref:Uncharacterized protein LOC108672190 n=1 Tax=Hyalella azteca TaxID=294128 RepID=A0A8B7NNN8_HYAAZ